MATATAPAPKVEELAPVAAKPAQKETKRPRPNINIVRSNDGPNSLPIFDTEEAAQGKEPRIAPEDEKGNPVGNGIAAEGYRLCKVTRNKDNVSKYTWARTTDMALATVAGLEFTSVFTDAKKRGRSAKADPVYINFVKMLCKNKAVEDLKVFLAEYENYKVFCADDLKPFAKELGLAA